MTKWLTMAVLLWGTAGASAVPARTFSVADFGAVPDDGKDDSAAIRAAAAEAASHPGSTLVFPPGRYDILDAAGLAAWKRMISAAVPGRESWRGNPPAGLEGWPADKNTLLLLRDCRGLTLDGQGSILMLHGLNQALRVEGCRDVVVRRLTIDQAQPTSMTGKVLACEGRRIDVEVLDARPAGGEPFIALQAYDGRTRLPTSLETFAGVQSTQLLREGVLRLNLTGDGRGNFRPPVGCLLAMRHILGGYEPVEVRHSAGVRLEDVTIHAGAGMGVVGVGTRDLTLVRVRIMPPPLSPRLVSTTADATHFINCSGTITLDGCRFEGMGDDHLNVHGQYEFVQRRVDERTIEARIGTPAGFAQWTEAWVRGWAAPPAAGDDLEFFRLPNLEPYARLRVASIDYDAKTGRSRIVLDQPLPKDLREGDQFQDARQVPALQVRGCYFGPSRARGTLITTRDAVVEDCTFDRTGGTPVFICCEADWLEAPAPAHVILRNNRFLDCGYAVANEGAAVTILFKQGQTLQGAIRDVRIEGNTFRGRHGAGVLAVQADGLTVRDNRFELDRPAVVLRASRNVQVRQNRLRGADAGVTVAPDCDAATVKVSDNQDASQ